MLTLFTYERCLIKICYFNLKYFISLTPNLINNIHSNTELIHTLITLKTWILCKKCLPNCVASNKLLLTRCHVMQFKLSKYMGHNTIDIKIYQRNLWSCDNQLHTSLIYGIWYMAFQMIKILLSFVNSYF